MKMGGVNLNGKQWVNFNTILQLMNIKSFYVILLFFIQFTYLSGQVILTQSDTPKFGSTIVMSQIYNDTATRNNFRFTKFGTNNIWDFTKLPKERYDTINFVDPKTLKCDSFETATFALRYNNKVGPAFYRIDNNGMYCLGEVIIFNPFLGSFEGKLRPEQRTKLFPYKLGDSSFSQVSTHTPRYSGFYDAIEFDSVYHILNHTTSTKVIASGSIILPFGTYPAILERNVVFYRDSVFVKDGSSDWIFNNSPISNVPYVYYNWFIQGSLWHAARIVQLYDYNDFIEYAENAKLTGIAEKLPRENSLSVQFNQDLKILKIESRTNLIGSSYNIGNVFGQYNLLSGNLNDDFIDLSSLSQGVYYIRIKTKQNSEFIKKIIVY